MAEETFEAVFESGGRRVARFARRLPTNVTTIYGEIPPGGVGERGPEETLSGDAGEARFRQLQGVNKGLRWPRVPILL